MNDELQHTHQKNWIAYLNLDSEKTLDSTPQRIGDGINGKVVVCASWVELLTTLEARQAYLKQNNILEPVVVCINVSSLINNDSSMSEMIQMLSAFNRCLICDCAPLSIGAIVDKTCDSALVKQIRKAGFSGLIPFHNVMGMDKMLEGINTLLNSKLYWDKDVIGVISGTKKKSRRGIHLTPRQKEVSDLICKRGLSNKQIAQILKISDSTVKIHVSAILKAYGLRTRTQLALKCIHKAANKDKISYSGTNGNSDCE